MRELRAVLAEHLAIKKHPLKVASRISPCGISTLSIGVIKLRNDLDI